MTWFRVDDGFATSPKVMSIPRSRRLAALGLWTIAGSWSAQHLTDGRVPAYMLEEWGADLSHGTDLVTAGLWREEGDGYVFHDWHDYQPGRADVMAAREKERRRKEAYRQKKAGTTGESPASVPAGRTTGQTEVSRVPETSRGRSPDPTRPDPIEEPNGSSSSALRTDVEGLLDLLDMEIKSNGGRVPQRTKKNRDAGRLLLDRDGKSVEQVEAAIRWCQADEFWRGNVLSMSKLREKYDQLRLAAARSQTAPRTFAQQKQDNSLAIVERLREKESNEGIGSGAAAGVRELGRGSGDDGAAGRRVA